MSFIDRELEIARAQIGTASGVRLDRLWAVQQALAWASDPSAYQSPVKAVASILVVAEDYQPKCCQPLSSDIDAETSHPEPLQLQPENLQQA